MSDNLSQVRWTLVARRPRAPFLRPVGNVPEGTWHEAFAAAEKVGAQHPEFEVWYVPTKDSPQVPEDRNNVLSHTGRRVQIRWDAAPQINLSPDKFLHMTATRYVRPRDVWVVECRCGWASTPVRTQEEARRDGDAHLTVANGQEQSRE